MNWVVAMVQRRPWVGRSAAAVLALCLFTACQAETSSANAVASLVQSSQAAVPSGSDSPSATSSAAQVGMSLPNFASLVEQHGPAVVNISTKGKRVSMSGRGMSPGDRLADNDGHGFFQALGDSVVTGPTLTNVNDFRAIVIDAPTED